MIGNKLAHYEITSHLGSGGMGEVYQATDSKLGRSVAIKFLPEAFTHDAERAARFEREARVLASLNHSNIAGIYGLEESGERKFLVMELVDGETLAERIKRGPIPVDESLAIAKQICEALEIAHEKGIIHRDLKPANVKITRDGKVKVLDFGLAKALETETSTSNLSQSPTLSMAATNAGLILGTAAYMSPEQAKGRTVDKRTDIFAFGCVLYEMLTGRPAFDGDDVSETLAAVLKTEPNWALLPQDLPPAIRTLIERCLAKDTKQRIADIAVAQFLLNEPAFAAPGAGGPDTHARRRATGIATLVLLIVAVAIAVFVSLRPRTAHERPATRFAVLPSPGVTLGSGLGYSIALSPDGSRLVHVGRSGTGVSQFYARAMDQLDAAPIRGSEGASSPFFSPDGQWIGFFSSDGKLRKVPVDGGTALTICDAIIGYGATWLRDDSIVFSNPGPGTLLRVPAAGGKPQEFLRPNRDKSERAIEWPEALPDGKAILFEVESNNADPAIGGFRLDTGERFVVIDGGGPTPQYLPSGHIVFARANELVAIPFDLQKLQVKGRAVPVLEGVFLPIGLGAGAFRASNEGSIAYFPATQIANGLTLVWVDRRGVAQPLSAPKRNYQFPRLSPDGQRIALRIQDTSTDIWLYQIVRGTLSRFTSNANDAETPLWAPDGKRLAYAVTGSNPARQIILKSADGGAGEEVIAGTERHLHLGGWSPKADALVATATDTGSLWMLPMAGEKRTLQPFLQTGYQLRAPTISPDGRWLAYASNETGRFEIYAQAFPNPGAKYQISADGGAEPIWAKNGRELFYRNSDKMMVVTIVEREDKLEAGTPALLFEGRFAISSVSGGDAWYDISADGNRFLMLKNDDAASTSSSIFVVQGWASELKRLAPGK